MTMCIGIGICHPYISKKFMLTKKDFCMRIHRIRVIFYTYIQK